MKATGRLKKIPGFLVLLLAVLFVPLWVKPAHSADSLYSRSELWEIFASIALYPDSLLGNVLMASTYPDDIKEAYDWSEHHRNLSVEEVASGVSEIAWDKSVKYLLFTPDVLKDLATDRNWCDCVAYAFMHQKDDVYDTIQDLRKRASDRCSLKDTDQIEVSKDSDGNLAITSRDPEVIAVPTYQPAVYSWWGAPIVWSTVVVSALVVNSCVWDWSGHNFWWGPGYNYYYWNNGFHYYYYPPYGPPPPPPPHDDPYHPQHEEHYFPPTGHHNFPSTVGRNLGPESPAPLVQDSPRDITASQQGVGSEVTSSGNSLVDDQGQIMPIRESSVRNSQNSVFGRPAAQGHSNQEGSWSGNSLLNTGNSFTGGRARPWGARGNSNSARPASGSLNPNDSDSVSGRPNFIRHLTSSEGSADSSTYNHPSGVFGRPRLTPGSAIDAESITTNLQNTSGRSLSTPSRSFSTFTNSTSTPSRSISTPSRSISTPSRSISTPSRSISTPSRSISTPSRSFSTPSRSSGGGFRGGFRGGRR